MDYKKLNEALAKVHELHYCKVLRKISSSNDNHLGDDGEGMEDAYNTIIDMYEFDKDNNIFLRVERRTDSYGDNEYVYGVTFVTPIEKKVIDYTPL